MRVLFNDFVQEYQDHQAGYLAACERVFNSGWFILGPEVVKFEQLFANQTGAKYTIGVANGLEALQIALMALGIGEGDEVVTTPLSAFATTQAIIAVGAKPVFVDTDKYGLLDLNLVESAVSAHTKAIMPVHLYGNVVNLSKLKALGRQLDIPIIEDAAQAHGATSGTKQVGTVGKLSGYSFYPTKNLGAIGDAGAITTNDKHLATVCRELRNYGQSAKYVHARLGLNSRLDELQAALLAMKLEYLPQATSRRRQIGQLYASSLAGVGDIEVISPADSGSSVHLVVITTKRRDALQSFLAEHGVESLVHYPATIPDQPVFATQYQELALPTARQLTKTILSLPCHPYLSNSQVGTVIKLIKQFYAAEI